MRWIRAGVRISAAAGKESSRGKFQLLSCCMVRTPLTPCTV